MKLTKARKVYRCNITNKEIKVGDEYIRINSRQHGVFHFYKGLELNSIKDYLMNEIIIPKMSEDERNSVPEVWNTEDQDIWQSMPDEF